MKKIVGGKYSTLKEKSISISEKIDKMAVSPHWRAMLNSTLQVAFNLNNITIIVVSNIRTKYQAGPSHQNIKFIFFFLFQSFPSCRWELVVEFSRGCWKMFL